MQCPWAMGYKFTANLVGGLHVAFMAVVTFAWLGPFWLPLALVGALAVANLVGGGRCPWTLLEWRLRRAGGHRGRPVGMMRRVLSWCGWRTDERTASGVAYGIALQSVVVAIARTLIG